MGSIALKNAEGFNGFEDNAYNFIHGCLQKPRSPAKTEVHRGSSTLRAARAPWGTGAAAASDCRDFDLEIWGATHHRVPCRNSAPRRSIMLRWGSWEALKLDRQQTSLPFLVVLKCLAGFALHIAEYLVGCQQSTSDVNQGISGSANNLPQVNFDTLASVQKLRKLPRQIQMTSLRLAAKNPACTRG